MIVVDDLHRQFEVSAAALSGPRVLNWLARRGIDADVLAAANTMIGGIGVARVMVEGRTWFPSVDPEDDVSKKPSTACILLPVWEPGWIGEPDMAVAREVCERHGLYPPDEPQLVDLLALDPSDASLWWVATSWRSFLGAEDDLDDLPHKARVKLRSSPLAWLRAGCAGVTVIDPQFAWERLRWRSDLVIEAEDRKHAQAIKAAMLETLPELPEIKFPANVVREVA